MENVLTRAPETDRRNRHSMVWLSLLTFLVLSIALVIIPVFLVQPFRPQTPRGLEISYLLRRWSPLATATMVLAAFGLVAWQWARVHRWWRKTFLVVLLLSTFVPAWFARQNHFEWMFNPLRNSVYVKASDASFVRDSDMVLVVKIKNEAVAYPVRLMAYHHIVQDVVGGTPICATY